MSLPSEVAVPAAGVAPPWRRIASLIAAQGLPVGVVVVVNALMTVTLDPGDRGRAVLAVTTGTLVSSLSFLQMHVGAAHFWRQGRTGSVREGLQLVALMGLVGLLVGLALLPAGGTARFIGAGIVGATPAALALYLARVIQGLGGARSFLAIMSVQALSYGTGIVVLFGLGRLTSWSVVVAWVASACIGMVYALVVAVRRGLILKDAAVGRPLWALSLAAFAGSSGQLVLYRIDVIVVGILEPAAAVGVYSLARSVAELLWQLAEGVSLSVFDEGRAGLSRQERLERLHQHLKAYRLIATPVALALAASFAVVVHAWLPDYRESVVLLLLLVPGVLVGGELRIHLQLLNVSTATRALRRLAVVSLLSSAGYVPLILLGGARAAAVGTLVIYGGNLLYAQRATRSVLCS